MTCETIEVSTNDCSLFIELMITINFQNWAVWTNATFDFHLQQFPFYATVKFSTSGGSAYNCGGALLNTSFAITSAICVTNGAASVPAGLSIIVTAGDHDNTLCEGTEQSSLVCVLWICWNGHSNWHLLPFWIIFRCAFSFSSVTGALVSLVSRDCSNRAMPRSIFYL